MPGPLEAEMHRRLAAALTPTQLAISNESARHHGHAGDDGSGESHFALEISAPALAGLNRVAQQRAVYAALGDLMDKIHALSIKVL
ncbi:MAG: BolA family transcriptional regulator [Alphaproteobacteria bacterium]|nr:BolA family transcriptional regulator [Alphaproteobacteria bacterium]MDE2341347.1 BolA family transcriptional regulator [Alphaproteobacteria bacterium]